VTPVRGITVSESKGERNEIRTDVLAVIVYRLSGIGRAGLLHRVQI
jgi:hypothetical protein